MATVRIIDMECSVPRGATDENEAASAPPRAPEAGREDRPAGYGMANYGRIFRARRAGEDHRPDTDLDAFMGMGGVRELERRVREEGFHALGVSALVDGIPASDRRFYPLYTKAAELG